MLEVLGEEVSRELGRVPNHEAVVGGAPRNDGVRRGIVHHLVRLAQERGRSAAIQARVRGRRRSRLGPAPVSSDAVHRSGRREPVGYQRERIR